MIGLGTYPTLLFFVALLIPLLYSMVRKRDGLRGMMAIFVMGVLVVFFYPAVNHLGALVPESSIGYSVGKLIVFVFIPLAFVLYLERWRLKDAFGKLGIRRKRFKESVLLGLAVLVVTGVLAIVFGGNVEIQTLWAVVAFFEAFTEEFFFRGVMFLYIAWKIDARVAFASSLIAFVSFHPQHYLNPGLRPTLLITLAQGALMVLVTHRTKNIAGPWIGHGLNRSIPYIVKAALGF